MDFFFALSGFVLCRSFLHRPAGLGSYAIKRVLRLAPMFLVTTAVMLALTGPASWTTGEIVANGLILQSLMGVRSINFVSWSIPFELILPAVGLFAAPAIKGWPRAVLVGMLVVAVAAQGFAALRLAQGVDLVFLRAGAGLSAGGLLYLLRAGEHLPKPRDGQAAAILLFGAALLVMMLTGEASWLAAGFPLAVLGAIWCGAESRGLFTTSPFQALGRWSYSIYLLHIPVLTAAQAVWGGDLSSGLKLALLVLTIALAALAFRVIERPLIELGARLARRPA